MANRFSVNPLGGFNVGSALQGLGQQFREQKRYDTQQQEQEDLRAFAVQAQSGDPIAMKELFARDPRLAMAIEQREAEKAATMNSQQMALSKDAETEWGIAWKQAQTPEEKELLMQQAVTNPLIDIEESDIGTEGSMADLAVNTMLYGHLGDKAYSQLVGGQDTDLTSRQKDFKQYQQLKKIDPEGAKAFGAGAGFVQDEKKRIFKIEDGVKYFSDGTEEPVGPKDKIKTDDMKAPMSQDQALKVVDKAKEGQLKNAGFALTLNDGLKTIDSMTGNGYDPMSASWVNKYLTGTTLGNLMMTEDDQKFVGSVEQMINAIARRETGAAITAFEKEDFFNRYMPVAGDKPVRIKQKRNALERQFKSIRGQSGSVYDAIRVTQGFDGKPSNQVIIKAHPQYGDVTEDDIQTTMSQSGMTREQVLAKLGGKDG